MKYTVKQYAEALYLAVSESSPSDQDRVLDNFVRLLKENNDLSKIEEIEKEFLQIDMNTRGVKLAEVISARELSMSQEEKIISELNAYVGTKVEIKKKIDEDLIGGVLIKIGDEQIDASIKGNLMNLKNKLITE